MSDNRKTGVVGSFTSHDLIGNRLLLTTSMRDSVSVIE